MRSPLSPARTGASASRWSSITNDTRYDGRVVAVSAFNDGRLDAYPASAATVDDGSSDITDPWDDGGCEPGPPTGVIAAWGSDADGQATPPAGTFTAVAVGLFHSCAVTTGGAVECWGHDEARRAVPPTVTTTATTD